MDLGCDTLAQAIYIYTYIYIYIFFFWGNSAFIYSNKTQITKQNILTVALTI